MVQRQQRPVVMRHHLTLPTIRLQRGAYCISAAFLSKLRLKSAITADGHLGLTIL